MGKYNETEQQQILHNTITNGTEIIGDINSQGDLRLDGFLKGNLNIKGRVVIGKTGKVLGTINCKNAEINGNVDGKIYVTELLSLTETAVVKGDIIINKLNIQPGCKFTGVCSMDISAISNNDAAPGKPSQQQSQQQQQPQTAPKPA
jgi:cytoskeletal protein CcmA (bactofilin family)